jgi:hypothetical protein
MGKAGKAARPVLGRNWVAVGAHLRSGAGPLEKRGRQRQKALRQADQKELRRQLRDDDGG